MYSEKQLEQISGAIITSFEAQHFLEECKRLKVFKHTAKKNVNRTLNDLKFIEDNYFNVIEESDENGLSDKLVANKLEFIKWLLEKFNFNDYCKIQEVCVAFTLDRKRLTSISDKIHLENGGKR